MYIKYVYLGVEYNHFGAVSDRVSRWIFGSRWNVEPERREKPGCGNSRFRRVRRFFHLHRRDPYIVRIRVQPPKENASGECSLCYILVYIY